MPGNLQRLHPVTAAIDSTLLITQFFILTTSSSAGNSPATTGHASDEARRFLAPQRILRRPSPTEPACPGLYCFNWPSRLRSRLLPLTV